MLDIRQTSGLGPWRLDSIRWAKRSTMPTANTDFRSCDGDPLVALFVDETNLCAEAAPGAFVLYNPGRYRAWMRFVLVSFEKIWDHVNGSWVIRFPMAMGKHVSLS